MSLYDLITELQGTSSTKQKFEILSENVDNLLLEEYLQMTYCPSMNYYIGEKTYPVYQPTGMNFDIEHGDVINVLNRLRNRQVTGYAAIAELATVQNSLSSESAQLLEWLVLGDAKIAVGVKNINKVWPELLLDIPYQRCSLLDAKQIDRIKDFRRIFVQLKADALFAVLTKDGMFTRNGSKFPAWFADNFMNDGVKGFAIEGELLWKLQGETLDRETCNGLSNKLMHSGEVDGKYTPFFAVWNVLPYRDWKSHVCSLTYAERYDMLCGIVDESYAKNPLIGVIETNIVSTFDEAIAVNNKYLASGYEGSIIKLPCGIWKYNTSKDCIKLKVSVDVDMIITSVEEATGKNAGMVGRINVKSSCGQVFCGVNANGTAKERTEFFNNREQMIGKVITCTCNDVLDSETKEGYSLFLGRADVKNLRFDKDTGDSLSRIVKIFESMGVVKKLFDASATNE